MLSIICALGERGRISGTLHKPTGEEGRFVRKGAVAGWREKFSESQLRLVDSVCGDVLARMGYPLAFPQEAARPELVGQSLAS